MKILTAFFDLDLLPCSYDAVTQLVHAKFLAQEHGCDGLHVVIVPNSKTGFAREWGKHDVAATQWRFWHIVVAAMPLAGATVSIAPSREWAEMVQRNWGPEATWKHQTWWPEGKAHFLKPLVEASRAGKSIPKLRATDAARRYVAEWFINKKPIVSITIRNQTTDPDRNSKEKECERFCAFLDSNGYYAVMIPDANEEAKSFCGFQVANDIDLRLAFYERCAMNILPNGGPQELCKLSAAPYLAFGQAITPGWKDHFRKYFAMEVGDQLPWARADQRLVYAPDSFENLCAEFEKWEASRGDR